MKRYLFLPILLIVISCTAFNNTVGQVESEEIKKEVTSAIAELKEATDLNKYEKIEEFFLPTFKNNIIVKKMQEYDLSGLTFVFSDVNVVSKNKANSLMVINFATESNYYKLTWKKTDDNLWKISNVAEKK